MTYPRTHPKQHITLIPRSAEWLNEMATEHHYMRRPIIPLACPFGWGVQYDGQDLMPDGRPAGFIVFSTLQYTRLRGEFGYPGLITQWQVLHLARLWLHDLLPFNSESYVMAQAHRMVQRRWLEVHPPKFPDQPYHIRKIISYADLRFHEGTVYAAANYRCLGDRLVHASAYAKPAQLETGQLVLFDDSNLTVLEDETDGIVVDEDRILRCFVYDLREPRWSWEPTSVQLPLFSEVA